MEQLHKRFTDEQVKDFLDRYLKKELKRSYLQEILGIKRRRFCVLVKKYKENPENFSIRYHRKSITRKIPTSVEKNILKELSIEKRIIQNKDVPLKSYNYSYIKDLLLDKYKQKVSLPTIINKAKKYGFYIKKPKKTIHDREVLTNYVGELIQHDTSYHKWSPYVDEKWYLITSLYDFSRFILYAKLIKQETSYAHIHAMESMFLKYGLPYSFYVDSHSIFRFVQTRDSIWRKHYLLTDDVDTQWKQVLNDCGVKVIYALSPQAKGKIERSYSWIQDRLVRTCAREHITDIRLAQRVLNQEIHRYNFKQAHSTTLEIPYLRFQNALKNKKSLFRSFSIKSPFKSTKDIFCLRLKRTIDAYRKITLKNLTLRVNGNPHDDVELRIYPLNNIVSEIRFWCNGKLIDVQQVKNSELKGVHF